MSMFDFSAAAVPATSRRSYTVPILGVVLELAPMGEANEAYFSDVLKQSAAARAAGDDESLTVERIATTRRRDAVAMAKHIVTGWSGVRNRAGAEVPFSREAVEEYLLEMVRTPGAGHIFDGIRAFARDSSNFTASALTAAGAISGNSSAG